MGKAPARCINAARLAVELAGDAGQGAQLRRAQLAVGNGHAEHRRVALHVPAVLQPQGTKLFLAERAREPALELVAELRGALMNEAAVEIVVLIHE